MPDWASEVRTRLSSLQLSPTRESEIVEELSQHLDDRWREFVAGGASPEEAQRLALAEFRGGDVLAKAMAPLRQAHLPSSITPGAPSASALAGFPQSLRYAARLFLKQPGVTGVAVLTLALGIGATTAIFSVVYGVLLKPLPFHEPDRLVALYHLAPGFGTNELPQSAATYYTYRDHTRVFDDIGVWNTGEVSVNRSGEPERARALRVTDGMLPLLGVHPQLGRLIRKEDDVPGAPDRVILTHGYWQRAFGAAKNVVGQSLVIDARPHEIIGILPASFKLLETDPQVILPLRLNRANAEAGGGFGPRGVARLKAGVTLSQASDDIARMIPLIVEQFPPQGPLSGVARKVWQQVGLAPNLRPLSEVVIGEMNRPLWILLGTVGVVLLMAWANVANLLLVRAEGRQQELAVRTALGASRGRMALELLSESLMLGLAGGALGVVFAQAGIGLLGRMAPAALPRVDEIGLDAVVLAVTLITSVVTSLLFGLIPVWRLRAIDFSLLKDAGRSASDAPGRHRTRNTLVVAQVALALVLLVVSGLMARTFVALRHVEPGFVRPEEAQTFRIALPAAVLRDPKQVASTYEQIAERLKQVPGVAAVGLANILPMDGSGAGSPIFVEDRPDAGSPFRRSKSIGPGYFETMGTPLVAGRAITWTDVHQSPPVMWISENLAREYWGEPSRALGKRMGAPGSWWEIVGVFGNVRDAGMNQPAPTSFYRSMGNGRDIAYVVRSDRVGEPGFLRELQQAVWSMNPNLPLGRVQTLHEIQAHSMAQTSFAMVMLAIAASVALLLALVGVFGVVSYIAAERTYEVGIRMALGAQSADIRALFLRHGLALTLAGLVLGIGAAMLATPIMSALLFGVAPTDPVTYAGGAVLLGAVSLVATYLPARRASRVEPIIALRSQ
jgi:putative ABC transport system permease protein